MAEITPNLQLNLDAIIGGGITAQEAIKDALRKIDTAFAGGKLPAVTSADNGKVLKVVNGVWTAGTDLT